MSAENIKTFLRDLGLLLHVPAILFIPTLFILAYFNEWFALPSFLVMACVSFVPGQLLYWVFKNSEKSYKPLSLPLVAVSWFLIPLIGSIPFYGVSFVEGVNIGDAIKFSEFTSALFEAMSGFTSTGLSMLEKPETIPHCLQWWRSISEWLGGMGVILVAVILLDLNTEDEALYEAEAMSWTIPESSVNKTMYRIWSIYIVFTIIAITSFKIAGMSGWESLNHGLTAVCTGGFTITSDSFISYNPSIKIIAIIIMIIGALSFRIHYLLIFKRSFKDLTQLTEIRLFSLAFAFFLLLAFLMDPSEEAIDVIFQVSSALGTCGFNSSDTATLYIPVLFLLNIAMIMGGNSSSTTGGVKNNRVAWVFKGVVGYIISFIKGPGIEHPHKYYFNGDEVEEEEAKEKIVNSSFLIIIWILAIFTGVIITYVAEGEKYDLHQIFFDVSSAISNVGLSAGMTGHEMNILSKWVFIFLMWIGRLEIYAVILLFITPLLFIKNKKK